MLLCILMAPVLWLPWRLGSVTILSMRDKDLSVEPGMDPQALGIPKDSLKECLGIPKDSLGIPKELMDPSRRASRNP